MPFPYRNLLRKKRHCRVLYIIPAEPELMSNPKFYRTRFIQIFSNIVLKQLNLIETYSLTIGGNIN